MGRNQLRKNYYKNSVARRRAIILQRFIFCSKILSVVVVLQFVSFLYIFCHDFLTQHDYFRAKSLVVTGANLLSEKEILEQAQINKGVNILAVNLSAARKRLLSHSWISEAEVSRELPSEIHIRIKEQKPLAVLDFGRKFLVNSHGEVFKEMTSSDPQNLPIVDGLEFPDINVDGEPRSIPFKAVMNVLELGQKSDSVLPYRRIRRIQVDREIGLTIYASDHIRAIKIGYNDYPRKYAKLKNVLLYLKKRDDFLQIESIDLNNINRIVVRPTKIDPPTVDQKEV